MTTRPGKCVTIGCPTCHGGGDGCETCGGQGVIATYTRDDPPPLASRERPRIDPDLGGIGRAVGFRPRPDFRPRPLPDLDAIRDRMGPT